MFDKNKFANILKNINDTFENQTYFAKAAGVNRTYLSQYMNLKLDSPPSPKLLRGIAAASKDITTYDELMQICGHINLIGLFDTDLNDTEIAILNQMLLDYKDFLSNNHNSFNKFNEQKYLRKLTDESKNKIIIAFRRNSLNLILDKPKEMAEDNNYFEFVAEDDAMFPLLDIGDVALVYKQTEIDNTPALNKGTYLIKLEDKNTIRKIVLNENGTSYELIAMNGCYKKIDINVNEIDNIKVFGKVVKTENISAFK